MSRGERNTLAFYDVGHTPFYAYRHDQRFSYCLYVPENYNDEHAPQSYSLVVLVHGTLRSAWDYRNAFAAFAEANDCIVLAPLFPANIGGEGDFENYKLMHYQGIRFDELLLGMVEEIREKYRVDTERFLLHGFSGGGHFAHRFFYFHPRRLRAVSVGAPGVVTLLDQAKPWWLGVADMEERFGRPLDLEAMRAVAVQMVVGGEDTDQWEIRIPRDSVWWMEGAEDAGGATRIDKMDSLKRSFELHGIGVRHDVVPGVGHSGMAVMEATQEFFAQILRKP